MTISLLRYTTKTLVTLASLSLVLTFPVLAQESEWRRLTKETMAQYDKGNYVEATKLAKTALRVAEGTYGADHPNLAQSLNILAGMYQSQGLYEQAEPLFQRSLEIREKVLGPDHPAVARTLSNIAELYKDQGKYSQAEPLLIRSLAISEKTLGPDHPDVALTLNNLASLRKIEGKYEQAQAIYMRSLAIKEKTLGPDNPGIAVSLNNIADLYQTQGQYAQAESHYKRSLAIKEKALGPDHPGVALSLNNIADLYQARGDYAQAEILLKRSLTIWEKSLGPDHPDVALSLSNLAELYHTQGQYEQAYARLKRSLLIREKTLGSDHLDVATSLNNLAELCVTLGFFEPAETFHRRSLVIKEKVLGPSNADVALSLNNLAALYLKQGKYAEAEPLYQRSLAIREKVNGPDHPDVASSLNNLAELYRAQGNYLQAEPLYRRSLTILERSLGPDHPNVSTGWKNLGLSYLNQKRLTEALEAMRHSNHIRAKRIVKGAENASTQKYITLTGDDDAFLVHAALISKLLATATVANRSPLIAEAFEIAQRVRTGATGAALAQMAARASAGSIALARMVRELQDAVAKWRELDGKLIDVVSLPSAKRSAVAEQALRSEFADTDLLVARLNVELERDFPEYRELVSPEPLSVADAQKLLGSDEALVTYLVTTKETLVWVIRPGRTEMIRLEIGSEALGKQVTVLRQGVDLFGGLPDFPYAVAHTLYRDIFASVVPHLNGVKHVMVVADGPLKSLPFGMLLSAAVSPKAKKNVPWLIRQYAFTNLPAVTSLRALRRFGKKRETSEPFIGFGDPLFKGTREEARGVSVAKLFARGALADTREVSRMARLPETADELKAIAKTLKAPDNTIRLREAATEQQVKQMNLAPYRVLAFATHGLMSGDFKGLAEPALALTPPETPSELDDGLLTASEVAGLKLNADWVILSACNTAAADGKPGADGFSGLTKAFFYAGSQTLLVSHWAVDSAATVALTTGMFAEAEKGVGRAEALRRSMLSLIDHPSDPAMHHPSMWAPFVVVGEGMAANGAR
jgi:CHAT domain-containing protein/tetratricopeptide (TPR) repeat protein